MWKSAVSISLTGYDLAFKGARGFEVECHGVAEKLLGDGVLRFLYCGFQQIIECEVQRALGIMHQRVKPAALRRR
jgi:hypothetical protein